jgi:hypothetical protein
MRRLFVVLGMAIAAGGLAFAWVRGNLAADAEDLMARDGSDIAWLRTEFELSDEQFAAIEQLHADYSPQCARHCAAIIAATDELRAFGEGGAPPRQLAAARDRLADLEEVCNNATREHLKSVSSVMPPEESRRFLRMTEPHLSDQPHDGNRGPVR